MAGKIKGITVEIGGDTTKLGKALKEVDSTSKSLQKELKGVNTLLKMDPSNVELIKQKQDILNESITATKDKLKTLKDAQAQVQKQFDEGKITSEQYRDFQREIVATEGKLKALTKQAKEFENTASPGIVAATKKLDAFGSKCETVGKKMLPITAGIAAVGAAGLASYKEVDEGADNVIKKTGATGEAAEQLKNVYKDVAGDVKGEFSDLGNAVGELNTRFGMTGDTLTNATEQFSKFAQINGMDVESSVISVAEAMANAGINSSEYGRVLDELTKAGQDTGVSIDTLTSALSSNGASFRELGLDTTSTIALLANFEATGVDTSTAVTGLKTAVKNFTKEGKDAKTGLEETITSIKNATDNTEALGIATSVFGSKTATELTDAIRSGKMDFSDLADTLQNCSGTVDSTFSGIEDGGDKAAIAMQNAKIAAGEIGKSILELLAPVLQTVSEKLKEFSKWFNGLSPFAKNAIVIIGGIVAAIGPALIVIGKIATGVSAAIKVFSAIKGVIIAVKGAFAALNAVMMANPIILIVALIAGLIAAFVYLWNNCEDFRNFWINLWDNIKEVASTVISAVGDFFTKTIPDAFNFVISAIKNKASQIGSAISGAFTTGINFIKSLPGKFLEWGKDMIDGLVNGIKSMASKVTDAVSNIGSKIRSFLHFSRPDEGPLADYETWMPDFMEGLAKGIEANKNKVNNAIQGLGQDIQVGVNYGFNKTPALSGAQGSQGAYNGGNVEIPLYLNGKEVARGIAPFQSILNEYYKGRS